MKPAPLTLEDFPDIHHLEQLRGELWSGRRFGRASVLVGAGFSANADQLTSATRPMPLFGELGTQMWSIMNHGLQRNAGSGSDPIETASDFEGVFGRQKLNQFLRTTLADGSYRPSRLHRLLTSLPWADVFTTNYDTLLERAAEDVEDRNYGVVQTHESLSGSARPRIVKLHGSFPDHTPFIVTREDYRCYPQTHSGFVNTVRQAVMETSLCLVGFGGTDPNFRAWSGWVRDVLDKVSLPIYLVGVFDLGAQMRTIHSHRGVTPIDLGPLFPKAEYQDSAVRHRCALEWFLLSLAQGTPDPADWPFAPPRPASGAWLPHESNFPRLLQQTSPSTSPLFGVAISDELMRYPGWLACPAVNRKHLLHQISGEREALVSLLADDDTDGSSLFATSILLKIDDILGFQFSEAESTRIGEVLKRSKTLSREWFGMAVDYLTHLRLVESWEEYDAWNQFLRASEMPTDTQRAQLALERSRGALSRLNYPSLHQIINDWPRISGAYRLELARASILVELGELEQAASIVKQVLHGVRSMNSSDDTVISLLALEGAAMTFLNILRFQVPDDGALRVAHGPYGRYRDLARLDCDPHAFFESAEHGLSKTVLPAHVVNKSFDIGSSTVTRHLLHSQADPHIEALSALSLFEKFNLPFCCGSSTFHLSLATEAAQILAPRFPTTALSVFLRAKSLEGIEEAFNRLFVIRADKAGLERLTDFTIKALEQFDRASNAEWSSEERQAILYELLSRLAMRLPTSKVSTILNNSLTRMTDPLFQDAMVLPKHVRNCVERCFKSLPESKRHLAILPLLELPLPDPGSIAVQVGAWKDPLVRVRLPKAVPEDIRTSWTISISKLLALAASASGNDRWAAVPRLARLSLSDNLTDEQSEEFGHALWLYQQHDGFPQELPYLLPSAIVQLPGCDDNFGVDLRERLLTAVFPSTEGTPGTARYEAEEAARKHFVFLADTLRYQKIPLGTQKAHFLFQEGCRWLMAHQSRASPSSEGFLNSPVITLVDLLAEYALPVWKESLGLEPVIEFCSLLENGPLGFLRMELSYHLQRLGISEQPEAVRSLQHGLMSTNYNHAISASLGISRWIYHSNDYPPQLRRRLIYFLSRPGSRAYPTIVSRLATVIDRHHTSFDALDVEQIVAVLDQLLVETNLTDASNDTLYADPRWLPETRLSVAYLASVISTRFPDTRSHLDAWRAAVETDCISATERLVWVAADTPQE